MRGRVAAALALALLLGGCNGIALPTATPSATSSPAPTPSPIPTRTPATTSTPGPTPTALPSATSSAPAPTPTAPAGVALDPAIIAGHLDALQAIADQNAGIRAAGTPGYDSSVGYVADQLAALGLSVDRQPFDFTFFDETEPVTLTVGDTAWSSPDWLHAALYSAGGDVSGKLEYVARGSETSGCDASDWSSFSAGNIALVTSGGGCYTRQKVELAQSVGALALISFYPTWGENQIKRPTLLDPAGITIPVVAAGEGPWQVLGEMGGATAHLSVHVTSSQATVENVLAEIAGSGPDVVMLGGHLDSALDGPGINDNGSGVATLLAIAAAAAQAPQPTATIRFGFWSAEEFGDLGSAAYVDHLSNAERARIRAYFNLDMVGSPNPGRFVYDEAISPDGSSELTQKLLDALDALGAPGKPLDMGGSSDHFAFGQAGVPVGGVFSGLAPMDPEDASLFGGTALEPMDPCYHLACDTRDNVDLPSAATLGQALATVIWELAY